uniref:Uncharacterized protein n=1 Tax=Varanus komodoensis TaxID=61221 RepID=A0A8D2L0J3_VARKO
LGEHGLECTLSGGRVPDPSHLLEKLSPNTLRSPLPARADSIGLGSVLGSLLGPSPEHLLSRPSAGPRWSCRSIPASPASFPLKGNTYFGQRGWVRISLDSL